MHLPALVTSLYERNIFYWEKNKYTTNQSGVGTSQPTMTSLKYYFSSVQHYLCFFVDRLAMFLLLLLTFLWLYKVLKCYNRTKQANETFNFWEINKLLDVKHNFLFLTFQYPKLWREKMFTIYFAIWNLDCL